MLQKTLTKVIPNIGSNKNRLEAESTFLREESVVKTKNDNKKIRVGDLNLGTVGNRKHTYFFVWPKGALNGQFEPDRLLNFRFLYAVLV